MPCTSSTPQALCPSCIWKTPRLYSNESRRICTPLERVHATSALFQNQIPLIALRVHTNESRSSWLQDPVPTPSPTPAVICVYCFTRGSLGWAQPSWEHLCYNPALNTISSPGIVVEMVWFRRWKCCFPVLVRKNEFGWKCFVPLSLATVFGHSKCT